MNRLMGILYHAYIVFIVYIFIVYVYLRYINDAIYHPWHIIKILENLALPCLYPNARPLWPSSSVNPASLVCLSSSLLVDKRSTSSMNLKQPSEAGISKRLSSSSATLIKSPDKSKSPVYQYPPPPPLLLPLPPFTYLPRTSLPCLDSVFQIIFYQTGFFSMMINVLSSIR